MPARLFITGVTGYIGGDALHQIHTEHGDDLDYALLVRSEAKAEQVKNAFPSAHIVLGDLDNSKLLEDEAAKANIVLHAADASDHASAAKAIAAGLAKGHSKDQPGYWLHTGGTGILTYSDSEAGRLGEWSDKEYNDLSGVDELTHLPDSAFHRNIDKIVLECGTSKETADKVKTVIVCPPTIYGTGRGPSSVRGRQVYELAHLVLEKGYTPIVGAGKARWNNVHVHDLSSCFALLVNKALAHDTDPELWGENGYVFTENGEHLWADLARLVSKKAVEMGFLESSATKQDSLSKDAALEQAGFEAVSWGFNSRGKAERARKVLGWLPKNHSIEDEIPEVLKSEKKRLDS